MKSVYIMFIILAMSSIASSAQSSPGSLTGKKAIQWFKEGAWLHGLKLNPHSSTDAQEFAKQYQANQSLWDTAFSFLRETNFETIAPGKYPLIGDDVFVSITEGPTKDFESTNWESHRKYIDIQYIYKGKEKLGIYPTSKASNITTPYNEAKDLANYDIKEGEFYVSDPQTFFIFFPENAHRPSIKVEGSDTVKKVVFKIRAAN